VLPGLPDRRLNNNHDKDPLAAQRRLVLAADADRRRIERELHEGIQQQLVSLAVKVQLARQSMETDALAEIARDVDQAIDDLRQLAERIRPPLLDSGGLVSAVRSAAARKGGSIDIPADLGCPPELAGTVYLCCTEALEHGMTAAVRDEDGALVFEILEGATQRDAVERIRDRMEAVGGRLIVDPSSE
jgi:signal transduction histidine kinase